MTMTRLPASSATPVGTQRSSGGRTTGDRDAAREPLRLAGLVRRGCGAAPSSGAAGAGAGADAGALADERRRRG